MLLTELIVVSSRLVGAAHWSMMLPGWKLLLSLVTAAGSTPQSWAACSNRVAMSSACYFCSSVRRVVAGVGLVVLCGRLLVFALAVAVGLTVAFRVTVCRHAHHATASPMTATTAMMMAMIFFLSRMVPTLSLLWFSD